MRTPVGWTALVALVLMIGAGLGACSGTPPSRFYMLDRDTDAAAPSAGPVVFVDQVTVVTYADRSQFVTRAEGGRVRFEEFDVWAEPISEQLTRYLVDALGSRFGYDRVLTTPPRRAFDPDWRIVVDVLRLDTDQAGAVILDARWTLFAGRDEAFAGTGRERIVEPADPDDVPTRLPALQRALDALADRIVNDMTVPRRR